MGGAGESDDPRFGAGSGLDLGHAGIHPPRRRDVDTRPAAVRWSRASVRHTSPCETTAIGPQAPAAAMRTAVQASPTRASKAGYEGKVRETEHRR